jgi:pyruvate/2-oxoglutarate dehydrogenase complex dihydrolipoamide dehydrogenase (E3) component
VLGGGAIGCELGKAFGRLGVAVTIVELAARILEKEDEDAGAAVRRRLEARGERAVGTRAQRIARGDGKVRVEIQPATVPGRR